MDWSKEDYQRLGDMFRAARRDLGYRTLKQFQDYLDDMEDKQLSGRTYADIEAGELRKRKRFSTESLAFLEDLFGWAPGVTRAILDGKDVDQWTGVVTPAELDYIPIREIVEFDEGPEQNLAGVAFALSERIDDLEARIQQLEVRYRRRQPLAATLQQEGGGSGDSGSSPATKTPGSGPAQGLTVVPTAASKKKAEPSVSKRRRRQDEAAEVSQDDGDDSPR